MNGSFVQATIKGDGQFSKECWSEMTHLVVFRNISRQRIIGVGRAEKRLDGKKYRTYL